MARTKEQNAADWKAFYSIPENREKVLAHKKAKRRDPSYRATYLAQTRKQNLRKLGWTVEEYDAAWASQAALCAICRVPMTRDITATGVAADHCHRTGVRRELLCMLCNKALGNVRDSVLILESAIAYLRKHSS